MAERNWGVLGYENRRRQEVRGYSPGSIEHALQQVSDKMKRRLFTVQDAVEILVLIDAGRTKEAIKLFCREYVETVQAHRDTLRALLKSSTAYDNPNDPKLFGLVPSASTCTHQLEMANTHTPLPNNLAKLLPRTFTTKPAIQERLLQEILGPCDATEGFLQRMPTMIRKQENLIRKSIGKFDAELQFGTPDYRNLEDIARLAARKLLCEFDDGDRSFKEIFRAALPSLLQTYSDMRAKGQPEDREFIETRLGDRGHYATFRTGTSQSMDRKYRFRKWLPRVGIRTIAYEEDVRSVVLQKMPLVFRMIDRAALPQHIDKEKFLASCAIQLGWIVRNFDAYPHQNFDVYAEEKLGMFMNSKMAEEPLPKELPN